MTNTYTPPSLEESISFYTRNDYLIVNNLLCGDLDRLWKGAEIANGDAKGVLKERDEGIRTMDEEEVTWYMGRIFEQLDGEAKAKILATAQQDATNILGAMSPTKDGMTLYRNARLGDALISCRPGDIVEFRIISSTLTAPAEASFGGGSDFYRYIIDLPPGTPVLELNRFPVGIRNEEYEVLLPPMRCRVKGVCEGCGECCKGIVELEFMDRLTVEFEEAGRDT